MYNPSDSNLDSAISTVTSEPCQSQSSENTLVKKQTLEDVQNAPAGVAMPIDRVGIKNFKMPIIVKDLTNSFQHSVAEVEIGVDLPAAFKGTHMSRFVEALEKFRESTNERLDYVSLKNLLAHVCKKLDAQKSFIRFQFPYFMVKEAPASKAKAQVVYECSLIGELTSASDDYAFTLEISVPVTTVCPCSKAISVAGAHGQRSLIHMAIKFNRFTWLEEFIHIAENSGSTPIYALLKREDEKVVTEQAYENACFVEDVVRAASKQLKEHEHVEWFKVEVESFESIHGHNAFASIEWTRE